MVIYSEVIHHQYVDFDLKQQNRMKPLIRSYIKNKTLLP